MSTTIRTTRMTDVTGLNDAMLLIGRILASIIFIVSGWTKLMGAAGTKAYLAKLGVPAPEVVYWLVVALELGGGLLLLVGFQTRAAAIALAVFCVASAVLAHRDFAAAGQQIAFMKNLAMAGGYLAFAAFGAGAFSLDRMMNRRSTIA